MSVWAGLAVGVPGMGALLAALTYLVWPAGRKTDATTLLGDRVAMGLTTGSVVLACALAWTVFGQMVWGGEGAVAQTWLTWMESGPLHVSLGAYVDRLTATMLIVVTTVSACVHVYSIGYMAEDPSRRRFFIYLSLFTLAMLLLVSASNLLQMFLGWEGVGVMSYLLIGFWHHKESANAAAMKAFVMNRVGDAGLLVGFFIILHTFGTLDYAALFGKIPAVAAANPTLVAVMAGLLFVGAMAKSAQFGLHTWLPDAMEGPTPVSALIHAATMVTAGVFLLCRMSPLFEAAPQVLHIVGWVGALTALFAATVGLTQTDIKRVIAYSTCSQLGYMFFAIGVSAYPAAMFHLTTHAFFKALLFLGAGSVIHGLHHEQNIFNMAPKVGDLRKALPITYGLMWLGSLALAGIPPFAGFFSKDAILESAFMAPAGVGLPLYVVGTLGALLTAIYSFRVVFVAFHGESHGDAVVHAKGHGSKHAHTAPHGADGHGHDAHTPHESGWILIGPMLPLAAGAVLAGLGLHEMLDLNWWQGAIAIAHEHTALEARHHIPSWAKELPLVLAVSGIGLAFVLFGWMREIPRKMAVALRPLFLFSLNTWYMDELYDALWVRPTRFVANMLAFVFDRFVIDGVVNRTAADVGALGRIFRRSQTGLLTHYAFAMLLALVVGLGLILAGSL